MKNKTREFSKKLHRKLLKFMHSEKVGKLAMKGQFAEKIIETEVSQFLREIMGVE